MGKREILAAAKKHGVSIVRADYFWTATPGEMIPIWQIEFGPEMDDEIEDFSNSQEAIDWINENAPAYREAAIGREVVG